MRAVKLTTPRMRGRDVRHLQGVLNGRLAHYRSRKRLRVDGVWGVESQNALQGVGYIMGLESPYGRPAALLRILHPHLRSPIELRRGPRRQLDRRRHAVRGHSGLDALPHIAERYVGVHEHPAGSNWGWPYPAQWLHEFGLGPASWCGAFAGAMILHAGGHVTDRVTFCPYIEDDARRGVNGFEAFRPNHGEGVGPGWLALFNWGGGSEPEHVEIVKSLHAGYLVCVGGNTSGTNRGWGGMVGVEARPYSLTVGYARPRL